MVQDFVVLTKKTFLSYDSVIQKEETDQLR